MSKTFVNFGSAWNSKKNNEIISCNIDSTKNGGITLIAKDENGQEVPITNFFMKMNSNKQKDTHPDWSMTFVVED